MFVAVSKPDTRRIGYDSLGQLHVGGRIMRKLSEKELKKVRGGSQPPGQLGYEGQPGNQGGGGGSKGKKGYEGQPGNQSHN